MAEALGVDPKDLEVEELAATSAVLTAAAHALGKYCDEDFKDFMGCRYVTKDPRQCLEEGKLVTKCAMKFFKAMKVHCHEEFTKYWTCLDHNNQEYGYCRKSQIPYDKCVLEKMNIDTEQPVQLTLKK
eukprot:Seg4472.2 transcript_id=Seg4472.2/GoldUCD/mRNA.D3Y31 product="NADH dehydrogenase" protein_id=Seg4472.2/GoldUCD/D3Y31